MNDKAEIHIVVAFGKNRELGLNNKLLWHLPEDLKRFKKLTKGHPVIMGRKTFESILGYLGKPLPNRKNIVITRNKNYKAPESVSVVGSLDEAIEEASKFDTEIHIGGGTQIYKEALPHVDWLHVTHVDASPEADTYFPEFENDFEETNREGPLEENGVEYSWVTYKRK